MGIIVSVYRSNSQGKQLDCTKGKADNLTVVNVEGPFEPTPDRPAALLISGPSVGPPNPIVVPAELVGEVWIPEKRAGIIGPMAGGNFAATSDGRWSRAVQALGGSYGAVAIHDRFETVRQYELLSR